MGGGEIPSEARYVPSEYQNGIFSIVSCVYGFFICLSFDVKANWLERVRQIVLGGKIETSN